MWFKCVGRTSSFYNTVGRNFVTDSGAGGGRVRHVSESLAVAGKTTGDRNVAHAASATPVGALPEGLAHAHTSLTT